MIRIRTCLAALTCLVPISESTADIVYNKEPAGYWSIIGYYMPSNDYASCDLYTDLTKGGKVKVVVEPLDAFALQKVDMVIDATEIKPYFKADKDVTVAFEFVSAKYGKKVTSQEGFTGFSSPIPVFVPKINDDIAESIISHDTMYIFPGKPYQLTIDLEGTKLVLNTYLGECLDIVRSKKKSWQ